MFAHPDLETNKLIVCQQTYTLAQIHCKQFFGVVLGEGKWFLLIDETRVRADFICNMMVIMNS